MERIIAIVEDSEDVAPLELTLSGLPGIRVVKMADGRTLVNALQPGALNLAAIITDLNLPFFDGFQILEFVRAHARYATVPVIVITGDGRSDVPMRAKELGASAFFLKPYSPAQIRSALEALIHAL